VHYRQFYDASLDRLGEYLDELQHGQGSLRKPKEKRDVKRRKQGG
jgi:hypothetical protein